MKHSTLTCVEQHLGFIVLIVYRHSKGPEWVIYCRNVAWIDPSCSNQAQVKDQLLKNLNLDLKWVEYSCWHGKWSCQVFLNNSKTPMCSTSDSLMGISTVTSSGCYRLLCRRGIKSMCCPQGCIALRVAHVERWIFFAAFEWTLKTNLSSQQLYNQTIYTTTLHLWSTSQ